MSRIEAMEIVLPAGSVKASLFWEDAPKTCAMIAAELERGPIVGPTHHAIFAGYEFYVYVPPVELPLENHVVRVDPGDLLYYFMPVTQNAGMKMHKERYGPMDVAEIAIWYGIGDLRIPTEANFRGNLFATVNPDQLEDFERFGRTTLDQGEQEITIRGIR